MELHVQHEVNLAKVNLAKVNLAKVNLIKVNLIKVNLKYSYINIQSVPRSKHSPSRL